MPISPSNSEWTHFNVVTTNTTAGNDFVWTPATTTTTFTFNNPPAYQDNAARFLPTPPKFATIEEADAWMETHYPRFTHE